jgi:hypothetical protein
MKGLGTPGHVTNYEDSSCMQNRAADIDDQYYQQGLFC